MRKLIIAASALALAGCSQADDTDTVETEDEVAVVEEAGPTAADGMPSPGMYKVTDGEGVVYMEEVKPDGTYVTTKDGELYQTGRWEQPSPDKYCSAVDEAYIDEDDDGTMKCNTEQIGEDGVWTSVNEKGETATVERVDS
ncbi:hypothetical protein [Qipengyuania gelatinilytica]|uniref:Lipoprotein n=1 Tax=Qipengyuania gelatinilytica TaxID=2867231 RepID=A0ABX9A475_9SPHN|nr:hypothetical protein [Qipengyuania gelatinilytica]QZD96056.1 hypothetical protein K3136_04945 [Qipengyuania gelatinilytica]